MLRSCIVENCSNNVKSQPNLHFFIRLSDKNRCWRLLQFTKASKILYSSLVDQLSARKWISAVCEKIQSSMYKILSQIYVTVSMGPSLMQSSIEFLKKFSFRWSPQFFRIWSSQQKSPKQVYVISTVHHPPAIPRNSPRKHMNPVVNN